MKAFYKCLIISIIIINIFCFKSLMADEVHLKNGDRLSGEVISMKDGKLTIKTSYAGEIDVNWAEISNIKTDKEISVLLSDGTLLKGSPEGFEQDRMILGTSKFAEPVSFTIADVKSINPPKEPAVKIKAITNVGITRTSGNTEKNVTHFEGEFSARTEKNRYTAYGELNKTDDTGVNTEDNSLAYVKYDHFLSKKWYANSNAQFEKDVFRDLNLRSTLGIGSGYQFYETEITNLSLEAGINYVDEDYIDAPDLSYTSGRWGLNWNRYFYRKAFQLYHYQDGYISLENSDDMFFKSRTGIRVPLFDRLNASLQYNWDYEKSPAPGREKVDKSLIFTLGYLFEN
jgi:putative salt-induced outer membrane protein YdiY